MTASRKVVSALTILSAIVFLSMTVDTMRKTPVRTHSDQISDQVVEGKRLWQHYDCNDCHTILGIGGYYAPDVTKSYSIRGEAWLRQFLNNPAAMHPTGRQMPNFRLTAAEIGPVVAYLKWVSEVGTNGWPPSTQRVARQEPEGHKIFLAQHCNTCHAIQGSGGTMGPDLTHEGSRQTEAWILDQLNKPTSHKADSVMPSFARLPEHEKEALAEYLGGLR